jgi:transcriptional regulator
MITLRQAIMGLLREEEMTARDISQAVGIREKEVYDHLNHIARSKLPEGRFQVSPARCRKCGFVFKKRDRLNPPGKCFLCKSESVIPPSFSIK